MTHKVLGIHVNLDSALIHQGTFIATKDSVSSAQIIFVKIFLRENKSLKKLINILKNPNSSICKKRLAIEKFSCKLPDSQVYGFQVSEFIYIYEIANDLIKSISSIDANDMDMWESEVQFIAENTNFIIKEKEKNLFVHIKKYLEFEDWSHISKFYTSIFSALSRRGLI